MDASNRGQAGRAAEKKTFYAKFADFLRKYRLAVIGAFGAVIVAVIAIGVIGAIQEGRANAASARAEELAERYSAFQSESDDAKRAELEKAIFEISEEITKKWPRLFAAQRAKTIAARVYESKSDWASAEREWLAAVDAVPASYLAPLALQNAAAAAEEQGADGRAIDHYKRLIEKYESSAIGLAHAYFALGRLSEAAKQYDNAMENYRKIVSTWTDGDWTKLATNRIIALKSQGLAK